MTKLNIDVLTSLFRDRKDLERYVGRLLKNRHESEDIVQEALLRTFQHADRVVEPRAFAFTAARNLATDAHRHKQIAKTDSVGDFNGINVISMESPEDSLLAQERRRLMKEAVDRLPPQCRTAFVLRIYHGCSYKQIAEKMDISTKTVEKHLVRALRELNKHLRQYYPLQDSST